MDVITLSVEIGEDHRLVIQLPPDTPIGTAQVTIYPQGAASEVVANLTREEARAKLLAGNILSTVHRVPENAPVVSPEERERIWALFSQGQTSDEIIDEERGLY